MTSFEKRTSFFMDFIRSPLSSWKPLEKWVAKNIGFADDKPFFMAMQISSQVLYPTQA
jgi:hypothetical protein